MNDAQRASPLLAATMLLAGMLSACDLLEPADLGAGGPRPVALLEMTHGQVQLERAGARGDAQLGYLYVKDALETASGADAVVRFPGGRVLEIAGDARFLLDERGDGLVLEVARGVVLSRIPQKNADGTTALAAAGSVSLQILTPFGITRVGAGDNEVQVTVGAKDVRVDVKVGSVEFVSRNGQPTAVNAGEQVALTADSMEILGRKSAEPAAVAAAGTRTLELEPIEVVVFASSGKVELKKKDGKKWAAVNRNGEQLDAGDALRVKEGRSLISLASGSRLWLERESEAVFTGSGKAGEVEETHLEVKKGAVTLALANGQRSRVQLNGLQLQTDVGGQFGVARTQDGFEVSAVAGDVKVIRGGVEQQVKAGQTARLGKEGAQPQVLTAEREELAIPSSQGLKIFHPGLPFAALTWGGSAERTYVAEVALDATFKDKVIAGQVHSNFLNVSIPRKGNLYWRIYAEDGTSLVDQGSAYFSPEPAVKDLARLRNEVPESGEKTTIFYQDKPPAVTFTYKPDEAAAQYRVVVFKAAALDTPVTDKTVTDPQLPLEAGALTEGSYVWSVTPLSPTGEELRGGKMNKLELVYDNSVPNLLVRTPKNGDAVSGGQVRVQGVAPVGAKLLVNGRAIELDDKNRFDAQVSVSGRSPQVIFRLSQANAADVFSVRTLKRAK